MEIETCMVMVTIDLAKETIWGYRLLHRNDNGQRILHNKQKVIYQAPPKCEFHLPSKKHYITIRNTKDAITSY